MKKSVSTGDSPFVSKCVRWGQSLCVRRGLPLRDCPHLTHFDTKGLSPSDTLPFIISFPYMSFMHRGVPSAKRNQLVVRSLLDYASVGDDDDKIRVADR